MNTFETILLGLLALIGVGNTLQLIKLTRKNTTSRGGNNSAVLDTCALIDGRIIEVAKSGFVAPRLLIPRSVIRELQYLADQSDPQRRERARYGLDIAHELQQLRNVEVEIIRSAETEKPVDEQLIAVAKRHGAELYTTDYNLNKVAQVEGVTVLNVNELAQALRPHHLPGEKATVKLVQAGQDGRQAVGYLDDGTMVVVEQARNLIGKKVEVTFTRMLQTHAGKMSFAVINRPKGNSTRGANKPSPKPQAQATVVSSSEPQQLQPEPTPQPEQRPKQNNNRRRQYKKPNQEDTIISLVDKS